MQTPLLNHPRSPGKLPSRELRVEQFEDRAVPAIFTVSTTADSGAGSLRQAITYADTTPGADSIHFSVAGTIQLTSGPLPGITDAVTIDGTTAPASRARRSSRSITTASPDCGSSPAPTVRPCAPPDTSTRAVPASFWKAAT